jgi:hypothetical protein
VIVQADLREQSTGARDAPEPKHRHVQVEAETYEAGRAQIRADLPEGWIVGSWRVDR